MKINKCDKLVCNLFYKNNYVVHKRALKQALNHWLILEKVHRVIEFNDQIQDEKLQYDVNWEVAKISALSSGKIDKHKYLRGEEILPSNKKKTNNNNNTAS